MPLELTTAHAQSETAVTGLLQQRRECPTEPSQTLRPPLHRSGTVKTADAGVLKRGHNSRSRAFLAQPLLEMLLIERICTDED